MLRAIISADVSWLPSWPPTSTNLIGFALAWTMSGAMAYIPKSIKHPKTIADTFINFCMFLTSSFYWSEAFFGHPTLLFV